MNKKVFSIVGDTLITLSFLSILYPLLLLVIDINRGMPSNRVFSPFLWEGLLPVSIIFVLSFTSGKAFVSISRRGTNTKLEAISVILSIITFILLAIVVLGSLISGNMEGFIWTLFILFWFIFSPYFLALIFLTINWFNHKENRRLNLKLWEKTIIIFFIIFAFVMGLIYSVSSLNTTYQNKARSIELCESKVDREEMNNCYTLLYLYKPESFFNSETDYCQRIIGDDEMNVDRREHCYESKAYYFKDPVMCDKLTSSQLIAACKDVVSRL